MHTYTIYLILILCIITVATVGVVATPVPTSNVTVLSESVPDAKWQWGMLASCSLYGYLASKVLLVV
jgi:hypothetical protein